MSNKYKVGDLVYCKHSVEIIQPMVIVGRNQWYTDLVVYYVKGKHKTKGNDVTVSLTEKEISCHPE